jgi:hypothetical protein
VFAVAECLHCWHPRVSTSGSTCRCMLFVHYIFLAWLCPPLSKWGPTHPTCAWPRMAHRTFFQGCLTVLVDVCSDFASAADCRCSFLSRQLGTIVCRLRCSAEPGARQAWLHNHLIRIVMHQAGTLQAASMALLTGRTILLGLRSAVNQQQQMARVLEDVT